MPAGLRVYDFLPLRESHKEDSLCVLGASSEAGGEKHSKQNNGAVDEHRTITGNS